MNRAIRDSYPIGAVDYPDVIRALVSLALSYRQGLARLTEGQSDPGRAAGVPEPADSDPWVP